MGSIEIRFSKQTNSTDSLVRMKKFGLKNNIKEKEPVQTMPQAGK
jgi:hypothetical protein